MTVRLLTLALVDRRTGALPGEITHLMPGPYPADLAVVIKNLLDVIDVLTTSLVGDDPVAAKRITDTLRDVALDPTADGWPLR